MLEEKVKKLNCFMSRRYTGREKFTDKHTPRDYFIKYFLCCNERVTVRGLIELFLPYVVIFLSRTESLVF